MMQLSGEQKQRFRAQVQQAYEATFQGWDFSYLRQFGGNPEEPLEWSYELEVRSALGQAQTMLDMGTGGGEFLASLSPLPPVTFATEAYLPNVDVARKRLEPLGVTVVGVETALQDSYPLPFDDGAFDLIINRHESYEAAEVYRTLKPGAWFVTQQVGGRNNENLRVIFGSLEDENAYTWNLASAVARLQAAGMQIAAAKEHIGRSRIYDIRALVYLLKVLPWEFPGFDVEVHERQLLNVYLKLLEDGHFDCTLHRFFVKARRP